MRNNQAMSLYEFLLEAELTFYHNVLQSQLKILNAEQLRFVTECDLLQVGMSKPEARRLLKTFNRLYPDSYFGRLKQKVLLRQDCSKDSNAAANLDSKHENQDHDNQKHIIPMHSVTFSREIGAGDFGKVYEGVWKSPNGENVKVACKCIASDKMHAGQLNFLQEVAIMHKLMHTNILRFFGVVLEAKSVIMVSELAPLKSLLECVRSPSLKRNFPVLVLCNFAEQICSAMVYLEENQFIHRDLACRNVLVFSANLVKISDFGLSRALGAADDYYRSNVSLAHPLPIARCAPECTIYSKFTSASDVFAYGICIWEMFSYGQQPWPGMSADQIFEAVSEPNNKRLEMTDTCPVDFYDLMLKCWSQDADKRPKFSEIQKILPELKPERVQAISDNTDGQLDHLQYRIGDIITVLTKRPREYPDGYYWKGIMANGRTGLFIPTNTVTYLGMDDILIENGIHEHNHDNEFRKPSEPASTGIFGTLRASFNKGKSSKMNRSIVAAPSHSQIEIIHTGHMNSKMLQNSMSKNESGGSINPASMTLSLNENLNHHHHDHQRKDRSPKSRLVSTTSETAALLPRQSDDSRFSLDLDTPEFENPVFQFDLGPSLEEEVFRVFESRKAENANGGNEFLRSASNSSEPSTPTLAGTSSDTAQLIASQNGVSARARLDVKAEKPPKMQTVKPMSVSQAKKLRQLESLANKYADAVLNAENEKKISAPLPETGESGELESPGSDSGKCSADVLRRLGKLMKKSPNSESNGDREEKRSFADSIQDLSHVSAPKWSETAEKAYAALICRPTSAEIDENPLRFLRTDGSEIVRSFRPNSGRKSKPMENGGAKSKLNGEKQIENVEKMEKMEKNEKFSTTLKPKILPRINRPVCSPPPVPPKPQRTFEETLSTSNAFDAKNIGIDQLNENGCVNDIIRF